MALRKLRYDGDELLRKKSKEVKEINNSIRTLLDDMVETMHFSRGVGLAAPQVGVLRRVVVIEIEDKLYELINPVVLEQSGEQESSEGCLSVPSKAGSVQRPERIKVKATDRNNNEVIVEGTEMLAVALCHELDHLDGILFLDKATEVWDKEKEVDDEDDEDEYEDDEE